MTKYKRIYGLISMLLISVLTVSSVFIQTETFTEKISTNKVYNGNTQSISNVTTGYIDSKADILPINDIDYIPPYTRSQGSEITGEIVPVTSTTVLQRFIPIIPGNTLTDKLQSTETENLYTFSISQRGTINYSFGHTVMTDVSYKWQISLYQKYEYDGNPSNVKYREIYTEYSTKEIDSFTTLPIGVYPGDYRISVKCLSGTENATYTLTMNFTETNEYECECNDTLSRYNELTLGKTIKGSGAKLVSGNDRDCFMFTVTNAGYINLAFLHGDMNDHIVAYRIYIFDAKGKEYFYTPSKMNDIIVSSGNIALEPGNYFVEIDTHIFCNSDYWLTVSFSSDSLFESESNDTKETADELILGMEKYGNLSQRSELTDRDWYKFSLDSNSSVVLDFIHTPQVKNNDGWNVKLFNSEGTMLYSKVVKWNDNVVQSPFIGLTKGTYYLSIDSDSLYLSSATYTLLVINTAEGFWESEKNDTKDTANLIEVNKEISGTLTENGVDFDVDYYKFTLDSEKEITVDFVHPLTEFDREGWIITVLNGNGEELTRFTSNWSKQKTTSSKLKLTEGIYFLKIDTGMYYTHMKYSFTVNAQTQIDIGIGTEPID